MRLFAKLASPLLALGLIALASPKASAQLVVDGNLLFNNGNTATCSMTVTLKDVSPPTITCPANATVAWRRRTCSSRLIKPSLRAKACR